MLLMVVSNSPQMIESVVNYGGFKNLNPIILDQQRPYNFSVSRWGPSRDMP